jgi:hypothetical protein
MIRPKTTDGKESITFKAEAAMYSCVVVRTEYCVQGMDSCLRRNDRKAEDCRAALAMTKVDRRQKTEDSRQKTD